MRQLNRIVKVPGICPTCGGSGLVVKPGGGLKVCPDCKGTGKEK